MELGRVALAPRLGQRLFGADSTGGGVESLTGRHGVGHRGPSEATVHVREFGGESKPYRAIAICFITPVGDRFELGRRVPSGDEAANARRVERAPQGSELGFRGHHARRQGVFDGIAGVMANQLGRRGATRRDLGGQRRQLRTVLRIVAAAQLLEGSLSGGELLLRPRHPLLPAHPRLLGVGQIIGSALPALLGVGECGRVAPRCGVRGHERVARGSGALPAIENGEGHWVGTTLIGESKVRGLERGAHGAGVGRLRTGQCRLDRVPSREQVAVGGLCSVLGAGSDQLQLAASRLFGYARPAHRGLGLVQLVDGDRAHLGP